MLQVVCDQNLVSGTKTRVEFWYRYWSHNLFSRNWNYCHVSSERIFGLQVRCRIYFICTHIFKVSWLFWKFFGSSLRILWEFFGNSLKILWELPLIVYIFKVSWLFTFQKSADTKNYLNMEGIDLFFKVLVFVKNILKVSWLFTF